MSVKCLSAGASDDEVRARAQSIMAVYMCSDCSEPYCAGRADCAALLHEEAAAEQHRCCSECEWAKMASAEDRRCMLHGHRFAIYKCDSCCDVAVWCCDGHHYCERCHNFPDSDKNFPCPGPDHCPLGIPHPRNEAANINEPMEHPSFVIGCSACLGQACMGCEDEEQDDLGGPAGYAFGWQHRDWAVFLNGAELLAAVPEEEIRGRLHALPHPLPSHGTLAECAERLLLREQGPWTAEKLLAAAGAASPRQRLTAVGLSSAGHPLECAVRLLFLLENRPLESLKLWDAHEALLPPQVLNKRRRPRRNRRTLLKGQAALSGRSDPTVLVDFWGADM